MLLAIQFFYTPINSFQKSISLQPKNILSPLMFKKVK
jgi:hypothetical protein